MWLAIVFIHANRSKFMSILVLERLIGTCNRRWADYNLASFTTVNVDNFDRKVVTALNSTGKRNDATLDNLNALKISPETGIRNLFRSFAHNAINI